MRYAIVHATDALCAETDPELFFPGEVEGQVGRGKYESKVFAKELCAQCPLTFTCLLTAIRNKEEYGIWGGATSRERELIRTKTEAEQFIIELRRRHSK